MKKRAVGAVAALLAGSLAMAGCASGGGDTAPSSGTESGEAVSGDITVLTNRTDLVDTVFKDYKTEFEKLYPAVKVTFEAITNYEDEVTIRMSTKDYGDVLLIPNKVTKDQLASFFEPLGDAAEMSKTYRFIPEQEADGKAYGIAITGNASGLVYNKKVWEKAGITELPKTPDEFVSDLKAIKEKTDATPYYTNYKDGWPLSQWQGLEGTPTANADARATYVASDEPWAKGQDFYELDSLIFNIVKDGLSESDPLTTNWEQSKTDMASGKIATMALGSWAIVQMQEAAKTAGGSADDIGYMPFPMQVDGAFHSTISGDYKNAINVNSSNKAAARAWIDWFANKSGYAESQGGISPLVDGPNPATLKDFDTAGVKYIELNHDSDTDYQKIYNTAKIDLWGQDYRRKLIDIARGAADGTMDSYFATLNQQWATARASVVK